MHTLLTRLEMFIKIGYFLLICLEIVTPYPGRKKSVYQKDLSEICKRRIISSVFLGSGVLETDSETLDLSKLELPYDCFVKIKAEPGNNIILVAQVESAENLEQTCNQRPNQFLALDMTDTYGGYWEMLATDFSTPDYRQQRPKRTWDLHNYHTPDDLDFETRAAKKMQPIATTTVGPNDLKSSSTILRTQTIVDQKSKQNVQTVLMKTSKTSKTSEPSDSDYEDISYNEDSSYGDKKNANVHEISSDNKKGSVNENYVPEENDSSKESKSGENDDYADKTDEDYMEEESLEEKIKVPVLVPGTTPLASESTAHSIPIPHLYQTPKPHRHFAPRYKNIISPKRPKAKGEYSDFVDDGRLDYLWRHKELPKTSKPSSTASPIIGYREWQRQHGGGLPIDKYVDYDSEDKGKTAQKPNRRKNASSSVQYFFKFDEDRKRITPNFKMLTLRTRLRYFQDAFTKSRHSTQTKQQRLIDHKAPHFKLKSTTKSHLKMLKKNTLNSTRKYLLNSTRVTIKDKELQFSFVINQNNKTMTAQTDSKGYQKLIKTSNEIKTIRNRTLLNKIVKTGKKLEKYTTNSENSTSSTRFPARTMSPDQTTATISKPKMLTTSNITSSTSIAKMASKKDIKPYITVSTHKSAPATTQIKSMKSKTEGRSKITITTINEHDFLKQLLSNFRRNAKADKLPQRKKGTANVNRTTLSTAQIKTVESILPISTIKVTTNVSNSTLSTGNIKTPSRTIKSTTNVSETTLSTAELKTIDSLLLLRTIDNTRNVSQSTLSPAEIKTIESLSPSQTIKSTTNVSKTAFSAAEIETMESLLPSRTIKRTSATVTLNISTGATIELNTQNIFKATDRTPMQSYTYTFLTTSFKSSEPLKTTSLSSTSSSKTTHPVVNNTETSNTKTDDTSPIDEGKTKELYSRTIKSTTPLNTTTPRNATLKLTNLANLKSTKSYIHSSKYTFSEKAYPSVLIKKEAFTKDSAQTTSKKYEQEIKNIQESNVTDTTLSTYHSSTKIYEDIINTSKQMDIIVELDILESTTKKEEENNRQNVIPLAVTSSTSYTPSKETTFDKATTQKTTKTTIYKYPSSVTTKKEKHENVLATTLQEVKTTRIEPDTTKSQAKLFVAAQQLAARKSALANFSGGSNFIKNKTKNLTLAKTWNKSTLGYKSWENLIQAAPDMISSLNRTKHLWKANLQKARTLKVKKRVKRRVEYIPIEDSKPHTREILVTTSRRTSRPTVNMVYYLADDQREEDYGRAHFGRLERYLGKVVYNICNSEQKKSRLVALLNTSTIILIMNDFNLERLNLIVTSATTIAQTRSQCPHNQLECQVAGVRVCIDMSSACDDIPNCGAYDIYDEDRILCGFNTSFKHSLILTAVTFIVMISIVVYSIHFWLERCVPHVSEAFFVYTDTAENVLYLDTIMRSPNATDEFPPMPYHVPEFEEGLRMRKRMVKRGLCSLLFRKICPCCKIFKTTEEAPMSLEEFDKDHSDTGGHFEKMFQYSGGDLDHYASPQDDKATQTSVTLGAIDRAVSFHSKSKDSLMNKLGDLRSSRSYHNEIELIKKMRDNAEIKKDKRSYSKDDVSSTSHTQRDTAEEEELRNTVYDMGITPVILPPVLLSEHEVIDLPVPEEEIEEALLVEPTKRLRFNEYEAGPSEGLSPDKDKSKKPIENKLRRTSVDLNKKKTNSKFSKYE